MVKNKLNIIAFSAILAVSALLVSCNDDFLEEKKNYSQLAPEIYDTYEGANLRVDDIYLRLLPDGRGGLSYRSPSKGNASDVQVQATEEFSTLSWYVDPDKVVADPENDWFHVSNDKMTSKTPWGEIRNCNDAIEGITKSKGMTTEEKHKLLGQVYFFRAWQYFLLVRTYGGVPIVKEKQAADVNQTADVTIPRSTTKACIDFMCNDLDSAASWLEPWGSADFGRITAGAALALKGRILLMYASPLFNRGNVEDRWQAAYNANKAAIEALTGFELENENLPGENASGWSQMFSNYNSKEAVFATQYNMVHDDNAGLEIYRNNTREQGFRPYNAGGGGGMNATDIMVDLFPMADGKRPTSGNTWLANNYTKLGTGTYAYDPLLLWKNRDPRFYRTFAFPGVYWRFEGDPFAWASTPTHYISPSSDSYVLWNYCWHKNAANQAGDDIAGFGADNLAGNYKGVYVRKRSNDFDLSSGLTSTRLYRWPSSSGENRQGPFGEGAFPHMEIRYAEVLLNLAESAVGINELPEAFDLLKRIRARAGYKNAGENYGLELGDKAAMFSAVLYERQIEFAYEGKRFEDMRRWLLWDGGATLPDGAPSSWLPSGFGGNTCTYLGVEPFNGKRRGSVEFRTKSIATEENASDPIKTLRPAALDLKLPFESQTVTIDNLAKFYTDNLVRKERRGDMIGKVVTFSPRFYFIGLKKAAQDNNITLEQNVGWMDVRTNAMGTFDPLAE